MQVDENALAHDPCNCKVKRYTTVHDVRLIAITWKSKVYPEDCRGGLELRVNMIFITFTAVERGQLGIIGVKKADTSKHDEISQAMIHES
jgi:hypothetical protein